MIEHGSHVGGVGGGVCLPLDDVSIPVISPDNVIMEEVIYGSEYFPLLMDEMLDFMVLPDSGDLVASDELRGCDARATGDSTSEQQVKPEGALTCDLCLLRFYCKSQLIRHMLLLHLDDGTPSTLIRKYSKCPICRTKLQSIHELEKHLKITHPATVSCDICLKTFHEQRTMLWHRKFHSAIDPVTCDICGKRWKDNAHLEIHYRIHTAPHEYRCSHCGTAFNSKGNRQKHIDRMHTRERKFCCGTCGARFLYGRQLKQHQEVNHPPAANGAYDCLKCGIPFANRRELLKHQQLEHYADERAYACNQCPKRFKQAIHLRNHQNTHTGVKAHTCEFCPKRFALVGDLRVHRRIHTREKPFQCDRCPEAFIMGKQLNKHRAVEHNLPKA